MVDVEYARTADGAHVAFRVLDSLAGADTDRDVVFVSGGLVPLELADEEPGHARLFDGLRSIGRLIAFDRRGIGLSDPITDWDTPLHEQWAADLTAIIDAACKGEVTIFDWDGFGISTRYAASHADRTRALVLYEPMIVNDDQWDEFSAKRLQAIHGNLTGDASVFDWVASSRAADPAFLEWYARAGRAGASPATAQRIWEAVFAPRPSAQCFEAVAAPILVLHRRGNEWVSGEMLEFDGLQQPNVTVVELDGHDHFPFVEDVDAVVAEVADFVVGEHRLPPPQRALAAVMFTDLVGSTQHAATVGDAQWKAVLDRHDAAIRRAVGRSGGTVVKTTGDGVLALFPSASIAVSAALRLGEQLEAEGLDIRVGIHVGDVDHRGDDVSGLAVNIAARVMGFAGAQDVVVTASVVAALAGQGATFRPMGSHDLKGVPGQWELFCTLKSGAT